MDIIEVVLPNNEAIQIEQIVVAVEAHGYETTTSENREALDASIFVNMHDIVCFTITTTTTGEVDENPLTKSENIPKILGSSSPINFERRNIGTQVDTSSQINTVEHTNNIANMEDRENDEENDRVTPLIRITKFPLE